MDEKTIIELRQQHFDNYKNAISNNIENNTNMLVDDIMLLIKKPPLDSMDLIKSKFLDLAKKNKIILNTDELDKILNDYRKLLLRSCEKIKKERLDNLNKLLNKFKFISDNNTFILYKKDFTSLNKNIKKILKDDLSDSFDKKIMKHIDSLFDNSISLDIKDIIIKEISKFIRGPFQRQLLESFDIKVLVKDTTLINCIKEQTDRYLFTLNNSRLLNNNDMVD